MPRSPSGDLKEKSESKGGSRRSSLRRASTGQPKMKPVVIDIPKLKEEKYIGIGTLVDTKDDHATWNEAKIIDVNPTTRLLKVHYLGWHKRHDAWVPLTSIVAHGSRVNNASIGKQSLKLTNSRATLIHLNPNYVEKSPNKSQSKHSTSKETKKDLAESNVENKNNTKSLDSKPEKRVSLRTIVAVKETQGPSSNANTVTKKAAQGRNIDQMPNNSKDEKVSAVRRSTRTPSIVKPEPEKVPASTNLDKKTRRVSNTMKETPKKSQLQENESISVSKSTQKNNEKTSSFSSPDTQKQSKNSNKSKKISKISPQKKESNPINVAQRESSKRKLTIEVDVAAPRAKKVKTPLVQDNQLSQPSIVEEIPTARPRLPSKSALAEIFRNRVQQQHPRQVLKSPPTTPNVPTPLPQIVWTPEMGQLRNQMRNVNLLYMEQQNAFLQDSIQKWIDQQDIMKSVTSEVVL